MTIKESGKRRGYIRDIEVIKGSVLCNVEDKDEPNKMYKAVPIEQPFTGQISVPPIDTQVVLKRINGGQYVVSGMLSAPYGEPSDPDSMKQSAAGGKSSISFVFGNTEQGDREQRLEVTPTGNGYKIEADVDGEIKLEAGGDISLSADGDILLDQGGTPKPVATADHTHSFTYQGAGDNSTTLSGETDQTDETTATKIE